MRRLQQLDNWAERRGLIKPAARPATRHELIRTALSPAVLVTLILGFVVAFAIGQRSSAAGAGLLGGTAAATGVAFAGELQRRKDI
ncbi:MAG: hypothetical protein QOE58_585 [Actinomycetota bacterium]|jgi:hypothetical protein|nr:hypothetical protein [Actinomycetota bacterium]